VAAHGPSAARRGAHVHRLSPRGSRELPREARTTARHRPALYRGASAVTGIDGKGLLVIISAPSGAGKDVVIDELVQKLDDAVVYVTATSRKPRPGEAD